METIDEQKARTERRRRRREQIKMAENMAYITGKQVESIECTIADETDQNFGKLFRKNTYTVPKKEFDAKIKETFETEEVDSVLSNGGDGSKNDSSESGNLTYNLNNSDPSTHNTYKIDKPEGVSSHVSDTSGKVPVPAPRRRRVKIIEIDKVLSSDTDKDVKEIDSDEARMRSDPETPEIVKLPIKHVISSSDLSNSGSVVVPVPKPRKTTLTPSIHETPQKSPKSAMMVTPTIHETPEKPPRSSIIVVPTIHETPKKVPKSPTKSEKSVGVEEEKVEDKLDEAYKDDKSEPDIDEKKEEEEGETVEKSKEDSKELPIITDLQNQNASSLTETGKKTKKQKKVELSEMLSRKGKKKKQSNKSSTTEKPDKGKIPKIASILKELKEEKKKKKAEDVEEDKTDFQLDSPKYPESVQNGQIYVQNKNGFYIMGRDEVLRNGTSGSEIANGG